MSVSAQDLEALRDWFDAWGRQVATLDFARARALFEPDVVGMGTFKDLVEGIDALEAGQWRSIWPTIEDFAFDLDSLRVIGSPDGRMAVAMIGWDSTGLTQDGERYDRPGRATVVLARSGPGSPWKGVHTHFSLLPGERKLSFGERGR